jgi:hypothetical protein
LAFVSEVPVEILQSLRVVEFKEEVFPNVSGSSTETTDRVV